MDINLDLSVHYFVFHLQLEILQWFRLISDFISLGFMINLTINDNSSNMRKRHDMDFFYHVIDECCQTEVKVQGQILCLHIFQSIPQTFTR